MPTKTANVSISSIRESAWDVMCDACKKTCHRIRLLIIGNTGFELCPSCVGELETAVMP